MGCGGGFMTNAYKFLEGRGFLETNQYGDGKYHAKRQFCKSKGKVPHWEVSK